MPVWGGGDVGGYQPYVKIQHSSNPILKTQNWISMKGTEDVEELKSEGNTYEVKYSSNSIIFEHKQVWKEQKVVEEKIILRKGLYILQQTF